MTRQRGTTLVEAMIVVGVFVVVIAGVLVGFQRSRSAAEDNAVTQRLVMMTGLVRDLYRGRESFAELSAQQVLDSGMVPSEWRAGNTIVLDLGVMTFAPADRLGFRDGAFALTGTDLRRTTCVQSLLDVGDVFARMEVNGVVVKDGADNPLTVEDLTTNCGAETGNTFTGVAW